MWKYGGTWRNSQRDEIPDQRQDLKSQRQAHEDRHRFHVTLLGLEEVENIITVRLHS